MINHIYLQYKFTFILNVKIYSIILVFNRENLMKTLILIILIAFAGLGCSQLKPLSPLAKNFDNVSIGKAKPNVEQLIGAPNNEYSMKLGLVDVQISYYYSFITDTDYIVVFYLDRVIATASGSNVDEIKQKLSTNKGVVQF